METLEFHDGTVVNGHVIETNGMLFVYLDSGTMAESFPLLNAPDKTSIITANRYGQITTYTGYNHLKAISEETGGTVSAALIKTV